jgi:hypothetical protein
MHMIGHYFERYDFAVEPPGLFRQLSSKVSLDRAGQHLSTAFWTPDEVKINQGNRSIAVSVSLTHIHSIATIKGR